MFERNKIDNAAQQMTVPAELTLDGGEVLKGRFVIAAARNIFDVLNGDAHFLEFETYQGERSLIARTTIKSVKLVSVSSANHLKGRMRETEAFDPYQVLGVTSDAAFDDIRAAYLRLSKIYHPDRFHGIDLPAEVRDYLSAMVRRINAAYGALEAPVQAARRAAMTKAQPIFTTPARG
jgi:hypothetical protein